MLASGSAVPSIKAPRGDRFRMRTGDDEDGVTNEAERNTFDRFSSRPSVFPGKFIVSLADCLTASDRLSSRVLRFSPNRSESELE